MKIAAEDRADICLRIFAADQLLREVEDFAKMIEAIVYASTVPYFE